MLDVPVTRRAFTSLVTAPFAGRAADRIRVAVVGTGHGHAISKIRALRSMPEFELAGVCRPDPAESDSHQVLHGVPVLSLDDIHADRSIQLVAVETADVERNLDLAERFVSARRFVHFDKPPGNDLGRLRKLLAAAARAECTVQMGYQWRYHPAMQAAIEAARKGWLGRVYRFRASIDKLIGPEERRHLARFPGGLMFSEGCHLIDRAVDLLGKPTRAAGFLHHHSQIDDGLADNTLAILEYPSAIAEISMAGFHERGTPYRVLEIQGTNGFARVQPYSFPSKLTVDLARAAGPYHAGVQTIEVPAPPGLPYTPDFREMATVIREGARPAFSPEHDLLVHETLLHVCGMLRG